VQHKSLFSSGNKTTFTTFAPTLLENFLEKSTGDLPLEKILPMSVVQCTNSFQGNPIDQITFDQKFGKFDLTQKRHVQNGGEKIMAIVRNQ